jgi:hypothetical protein
MPPSWGSRPRLYAFATSGAQKSIFDRPVVRVLAPRRWLPLSPYGAAAQSLGRKPQEPGTYHGMPPVLGLAPQAPHLRHLRGSETDISPPFCERSCSPGNCFVLAPQGAAAYSLGREPQEPARIAACLRPGARAPGCSRAPRWGLGKTLLSPERAHWNSQGQRPWKRTDCGLRSSWGSRPRLYAFAPFGARRPIFVRPSVRGLAPQEIVPPSPRSGLAGLGAGKSR